MFYSVMNMFMILIYNVSGYDSASKYARVPFIAVLRIYQGSQHARVLNMQGF